ncbi:12259_t:CDS:2 [Funneliformis mosseae]|uniref:12259_t:CDS:1 n=1 Tax=Funneliformis mosseae TaxID=27381 RepID=A0A9N9D9A1_FUNMO|nr:12259_t:CDS:2 [Funneliformis mosseae]
MYIELTLILSSYFNEEFGDFLVIKAISTSNSRKLTSGCKLYRYVMLLTVAVVDAESTMV